jgi:hypothetical protein
MMKRGKYTTAGVSGESLENGNWKIENGKREPHIEPDELG